MENKIQSSSNLKQMTFKAIFSIIMFIVVYIILICSSIGLTILCGFLGLMIIAIKPMFLTIAIGLGFVGLGVFVLIFLFKFIFSKHKTDLTNFIEIKQSQEPKLFEIVESIIKEVGTSFPKKIYLSTEVNACVFYNSSFWSMFFPIKKNLQIGLGLVNSVTEIELKAILSHEFGHFSQRSMRLGSYVYYVNKIIYDLLFDNESYEVLVRRWSNYGWYFSMFIPISVFIVQKIQLILKKMFEIVNLNYLGLSREMEFQADEIAANIVGSLPLKTSLLRMDLADHSFNSVLNYFEHKIPDRMISKNIYNNQNFILNFLATENSLSIENNLPVVTFEEYSKYNKSKFNIKDQWASHPSIEERIQFLDKLNIIIDYENKIPANFLFKDINKYQKLLSHNLFSKISYNGSTTVCSEENFKIDFITKYNENSFDKIFKGYYDDKNPVYFDINQIDFSNHSIRMSDLFNNKNNNLVYTAIGLENDLNNLTQIEKNLIEIKTFDYDGEKYNSSDCKKLIPNIILELEQIKQKIEINDKNIFIFFNDISRQIGKVHELTECYKRFDFYDKDYDLKYEIFRKISEATNFIRNKTPYDIIEKNIKNLTSIEISFKNSIRSLMDDNIYTLFLNKEIKDNFDFYVSKDFIYFSRPNYYNDALNVMITAINDFCFILDKGYFFIKKDLLDFQKKLIEDYNHTPFALRKNQDKD